jgi:hypothetical protein
MFDKSRGYIIVDVTHTFPPFILFLPTPPSMKKPGITQSSSYATGDSSLALWYQGGEAIQNLQQDSECLYDSKVQASSMSP